MIPGSFIGSLEELVTSFGGVCTVLGSAVENAAVAPERVVDRFNAARDALEKMLKHSQEMQNQSLQEQVNNLKETLEYQESQTSALREERDLKKKQQSESTEEE